MTYILWKDNVIGEYCQTPARVEDTTKLIAWLKENMPGFTYPRTGSRKVKSYRGNPVEFIPKLEYIDCFISGKSIHSFYYDLV
jgi:hypothetical protein